MQNIEECIAALKFPEPEPAPEPVAEQPAPVAAEAAPVADAASTPAPATEAPAGEKQPEAKKDSKTKAKPAEEPENEFAKDGVSLDDLFSMKPEIFSTPETTEEDSTAKKGKKTTKKKSVELQFDEGLGEVVGRKRHKRSGGDDWSEEE